MDTKLLPIGSKVHHTGHGDGTIIDYNGTARNEYVQKHLGEELVNIAVSSGLGMAIIDSFYSGDRFPYVIEFDSGYIDVYATYDVTEVVPA
jgi:hypothetical protein